MFPMANPSRFVAESKRRWHPRHALLLAAICLAAWTAGRAQEVNPPYPHFGITTFSGLTDASVDILKDFDVIAMLPNAAMARKYKAQNPNVILLATMALFISERMNLMGAGPTIPEGWYFHDASGNRFELWGGASQMNISPYCPRIDVGQGLGPVPYADFALDWMSKNVDFSVFNGTWHDWWWPSPGYNQCRTGDFNNNRIPDQNEWGSPDSVGAVWWRSVLEYHKREYQIPGCKYVLVQIGGPNIFPYVNGAVFEDWPMYNGPFVYWLDKYNDAKTASTTPRLNIFDASHRYYYLHYPVQPYKNNYRAVRFGLASCLLTSAYFYVDEGGDLGHHANVHIYDEFEAKGKLGYPVADGVKLPGKTLASTPLASGVWVRFFNNGVSVVNATGLPQTVRPGELAALDPMPGSRYYRFQGGQDPDFNNGQEVTDAAPISLWGDTKISNWKEPEVFGDGCMLFRTRKALVTPIVVDNHVNNQTSPGSDPVQYTGSWVLSSEGGQFYAFYTDRNYAAFQPDGFAWSQPGQGENVARYVPTIGIAGSYEVFEWHGYRGASPSAFPLSADVPVKITHAGGDTSFVINQTTDFGKWNSLGVYSFDKGKTGGVEIMNRASGIVLSDAVRFVFRGTPGQMDTQAPLPPQGVRVERVN
jgi:hypothetical protein